MNNWPGGDSTFRSSRSAQQAHTWTMHHVHAQALVVAFLTHGRFDD